MGMGILGVSPILILTLHFGHGGCGFVPLYALPRDSGPFLDDHENEEWPKFEPGPCHMYKARSVTAQKTAGTKELREERRSVVLLRKGSHVRVGKWLNEFLTPKGKKGRNDQEATLSEG
jgi:hypothetical protein